MFNRAAIALTYRVATRRTTFNRRDGRWLLLALLAHALMLALPLGEWRPVPVPEAAELRVRLISERPARARGAEPPTTADAEEVFQKPEDAIRPAAKRPSVREIVAPPQPPIASDQEPLLSAARIYHSRNAVAGRVPLEMPGGVPFERLGVAAPHELPENWRRGTGAKALAPFDNTFNGMTAPGRIEIVDRWLAADGSHNVIVETPAGLRLCGRALPWDATRPLVEHVMLFHVCGGDGAKGFKYEPRRRPDRDFIVPVANDATEP